MSSERVDDPGERASDETPPPLRLVGRDDAVLARMKAAAAEVDRLGLPTPALVIDPETLAGSYRRLTAALPDTDVHFATKCNPNPDVLRLLVGLGVDPSGVVFTTPVKPADDIAGASELGVTRFVCDAVSEVAKLAEAAPGCSVFVRVAVDDEGSRWPLSTKFGCDPSDALELLSTAASLGLDPEGLSFHVGSQEVQIAMWEKALITCADLVAAAADDGIALRTVNVGGGFPVPYEAPVPHIDEIAAAIRRGAELLPDHVSLVMEPGRYLVAEAGTTIAGVVGVTQRHEQRWAYLDVGAFNGLYEASRAGGGLRYPTRTLGRPDDIDVLESFVVAGPSCDADDVIGPTVMLSADLAAGDRLAIANTGAYSIAYASTFCGIDGPQVHVVGGRDAYSSTQGRVYDLAWPGSRLFEQAKALESDVFSLQDFVAEEGDEGGFASYDIASTFVVATEDDQVHAALRLIWMSPRGFKTLNDLPVSEEGQRHLDAVDASRIAEIGTVAAHPAARGMGPAIRCYHGMVDVTASRGVTHVIASIDDGLLEVFRTQFMFRFVDLGPSQDYYGSPTTPALLDIPATGALLADHLPDLHRQVFLGAFSDEPQTV